MLSSLVKKINRIRKNAYYKRFIFKLIGLIIVVQPYVYCIFVLPLNTDPPLSEEGIFGIDFEEFKKKILELTNSTPEQMLVNPNILLQTLIFSLQQVAYDDPKLIEFVRAIIQAPSKKQLKLNSRSTSDYSVQVDEILKHKKNGFFIEAGAYDGEAFSNTLFFEIERNWTGLLIEPVPSIYRDLLTKNRNAYAINACIGDNKPSVQMFNILHVLSGRDDQMSLDHRKRLISESKGKNTVALIPCFPLSTILKAININHIDYFSLDVEGGELSIIDSIKYNEVFINIFTIESSANHFHTDKIIQHLTKNNYKLIKNEFNELYFSKI